MIVLVYGMIAIQNDIIVYDMIAVQNDMIVYDMIWQHKMIVYDMIVVQNDRIKGKWLADIIPNRCSDLKMNTFYAFTFCMM